MNALIAALFLVFGFYLCLGIVKLTVKILLVLLPLVPTLFAVGFILFLIFILFV